MGDNWEPKIGDVVAFVAGDDIFAVVTDIVKYGGSGRTVYTCCWFTNGEVKRSDFYLFELLEASK